jgi:predicted lipoprotein with Yx(FWY)xxD motif
MRKLVLCGAAFALLLASAVAGAAHSETATATKKKKTVTISTRKVPGLGRILVDAKGRTLYMFVPDKHKRVTCVKVCAAVWPPVKATKGEKIVGTHGVKAKLLGSDKNPSGGRVVTYAKWPLYLYVADKKPGQATGQALDLNGGLWYVMSPSGKVIKKKARH